MNHVFAAAVIHFAGFLCETSLHATMFADSLAISGVEDIAIDEVGKAAGAQVCGFYSGEAAIGPQARVVIGGALYQITRYTFQQDGREAFGAARVFDAGAERAEEGL